MPNFDDFKIAVEAISNNENTVLIDDMGMPSIMFKLPKMSYADVIEGGTQETLPCFIVDGVEKEAIYISKFTNIVLNERAYSLPLKDPTSCTFDRAIQVCRNKGNGWGLCPGSAWTAVALWSKKNGTVPHGNNNFGKEIMCPYEKGVPVYKIENTVYRIATGSGPVTWNHNHTDSGIADMNGNVWEWTADLRLMDGEIQIIPYANSMKMECNMGSNSLEWKAIMPNGTLVAPGTAGTLKFNGTKKPNTTEPVNIGNTILDTKCDKPAYEGSDTNGNYAYLSQKLETVSSVPDINIPQLLKAYGVFPTSGNLDNDIFLVRNYGERIALRGGSYWSNTDSGVFALHFGYNRSNVDVHLGFRAAFITL